ncbi:MAG: hypothetical protein M2R45_00059 [Verrucomicrobia subdivision 3 bacterium]|nr:hypothetical protein [Limisphaerales bacterium]MCS1412482.1 hypothetical protein [Limisphaerales bacterium]
MDDDWKWLEPNVRKQITAPFRKRIREGFGKQVLYDILALDDAILFSDLDSGLEGVGFFRDDAAKKRLEEHYGFTIRRIRREQLQGTANETDRLTELEETFQTQEQQTTKALPR